MSDDDFEIVRGTGNVFRDTGTANAEVLQLKAILAGKIIDVLNAQEISVRGLERWFSGLSPDIVLWHIGTNDTWGSTPAIRILINGLLGSP